MKRSKITFLLVLLMSMVSIQVTAHSGQTLNGDGKTIYFRYVNKNTAVYVTYRGDGNNEYNYSVYSGDLNIPASITIGETSYPVIGIDEEAFYKCTGLTSVTIPNSVTSIGDDAFQYCTNLSSVNIPNSVTSIGSTILDGTGWKNNQSDGLLYLDNWLLGYKGSKPTGSQTIAQGTKGIAGWAFSSCSGLTSITIPNSVTSIGEWAFQSSGLSSIEIPNSVTKVSDYMFGECI